MFRNASTAAKVFAGALSIAAGLVATASTALAQQGGAAPGSIFEQMVPMLFFIAVLYILVFRPQMKKQKDHQKFVSELKRGDEVVTSSGILGRIEGLTEQFITLEIAPDVRVKVLRSQVASSAQSITAAAGAKA